MKPKIIVVGSSNTDMVVKVPHIPAPGETLLGTDFMIIPGGKGANQAVAAARSGAEVTFLACVSNDTLGIQAVDNYKKDAINTEYVKVQEGIHSGIALINVADDGENSIAVAPGANKYLLPEDIVASGAAFNEVKMVLAQLEIPLPTVIAVAELAHEKGIPFILNPAPGMHLPESLIQKVTVITPNETEAAILTSRDHPTDKDIPAMAGDLYRMGIKIVLLTLGRKGVYLKTNDYDGYISGYSVEAKDTTAAGDVFNGALATAMADGNSIADSVDFAQRAAAISVTRMGAQPSAPYIDEILNFEV
ncbi:MAG TPA: ribokinase [Mariniphaga sp.]|nr:ribokinase [Mariniphaga sp.]